MADMLRRLDQARICVTDSLWVGGDDGRWHQARVLMDPVFQVPLWSVDSTGSGSYPEQAINLSQEDLGSAFYIKSPDDGLYHQFILTATDPATFGYVWTDYAQVASPPSAIYRTVPHARLDAGLYLSDSGEGSVPAQIHKFRVLSGFWSDESQGLTVPQ